MRERKKPVGEEQALLKLAGLCARTETCISEARVKLMRMGLGEEARERVIDRLVADRYIDEARYARAFASDKVRFAGWGRAKIALGLRAKRIDSALINEALDAIDHDLYAESLLKRARALAKGVNFADYNDRARLYRRLVSRGYEPVFVNAVIKSLAGEQRSEP